ncbi:arylesterase [Marinimicrobium sp. ABcell2]|uniref:arylesterase n=1 Tax=Marinimicrobium sp. ABcell2 TaxID=3069751 RepID=UPI0027B54952|nr:arylesterase [Marinimicrobium sp. ABcell2]MDQ2077311.1 arylesterase [Marinimicrobium sp. ABcell2]
MLNFSSGAEAFRPLVNGDAAVEPLKRCLFLCFSLVLAFNTWASENDRPVILVMGDSLSAGYGIDLDEGWVSLLQARLDDHNYRHRVVNASVSGETTTGGLARLPTLLERHQPSLVILELGGNDGLRGHPISALRNNLNEMIKLSQDAGAQVLLVGMQIPPSYGRRYADQFAEVYPALAEQHEIPLVGFLLEGVATDLNLMQRDGIHPKAEAQPRILENVWPDLLPLLQETAQLGSVVNLRPQP